MSLALLSPEILLVAVALAIYMGGAVCRSDRPWAWLAAAGLAGAAAALACSAGQAAAEPLAVYVRWLALGLGAVLVLTAWRPLASGGTPEYLGSLLLAVAGLMLAAAAGNLVLLFVSLELISIPTYILLSLGRPEPAGQEAAAKYFFLSILASAMFLYGLSFLYGATGSMQLDAIRAALAHPATLLPGFELLVTLAMALVVAGLCFRVTAVPFHFYAPDVYQGTIHANAAFLSVVPKAAGLVVLMRLVLVAMPDMAPHAWKVVLALSVLSMTLGNLLALWQDNVRRLLAYSSIANAGYMLIGLCVALAAPSAWTSWDGVAAMLFYLCVYALATLGTFAALACLGRAGRQIDAVEDLAGLGRTRPAVAAAVAVCMFSLAGLPPAAGLLAKLLIFGSAVIAALGSSGPQRTWLIALAVVGVLNAAVGAYYYLRIVGVMYFRAPPAARRADGGRGPWLAAMACALAVLALGVYPGPLLRVSTSASPSGIQVSATDDGPTPFPRPGTRPPVRVGQDAAVRAR